MSGDGTGGSVRRPRRITRPRVPPGPLRELKELLFRLYAEAGYPSLDEIHASVRREGTEAVTGWPGRDSIHRVIRDAVVPPSQADTVAVAAGLARLARWDARDAADRARELWVRAQMAEPVGIPIKAADPFAFEVHRAIQPEDGIDGLPLLPEYVPREHDLRLAKVVQAARGGKSAIAVLVGGSSTGKTRTCWEAVQTLPEGWRLWHPIDPGHPEAVLNDLQAVGPRTVLWLNELQHYLLTPASDLGARVAAGLRELLRDPGRAPVLVLGTTWPDHWAALTSVGNASGHAQTRALLAGTSIEVPDAFTEADLEGLRTAADPRLVQAARHAEQGQVTQYLAGVPALLERYRAAPAAAKALIRAAMDARRLGHGPALPKALLADAAPGYLTDQQWESLGDDWLEEALAYTSEPCRGVRGPLTRIRPRPGQPAPERPCYRLADYLEHVGYSLPRTQTPPAALWDALLAHAGAESSLVELGREAENRGLYRYAFSCYAAAADAGERYALSVIAALFRLMGRSDEAITWFQARVEAGDRVSLGWLAHQLRDADRTDEAMAVYRRAADLGDANAMRWLAGMLRQAGRKDEALRLHQQAVEAYGTDHRAGEADLTDVRRLMTEAGRVEELITWLRARAEAGNAAAAQVGARLLREGGRYDEGISLALLAAAAYGPDTVDGHIALRKAAELMTSAGRTQEAISTLQKVADERGVDPWVASSAEYEAVQLLRGAGRTDEAIAWLKRRVAAGKAFGHRRVTELFEEQGRADEAITWLVPLAETGDHGAANELADLLERMGRTEEAIAWLRAGVEAGGWYLGQLTDKLCEDGRSDEAIALCRRLAVNGDDQARVLAAELLRNDGRTDEAIALLAVADTGGTEDHTGVPRRHRARSRVAAGRTEETTAGLKERFAAVAAEKLIDLLLEAGRREEAIARLKNRVAAGDAAVDEVADLLVEAGQCDEAIAWLRDRVAAGDTAAAAKAVALLLETRGLDEAVAWLRDPAVSGDAAVGKTPATADDAVRTDEVTGLRARVGWRAFTWVADALREAGRIDEAIAFYQKAAEAGAGKGGTTWANAATSAIELLRARGRADEALGWLKAQAAAGVAEALEQTALVLQDAGHFDEALRFWGRAIESGNSTMLLIPPYAANVLRDAGYGEQVDRINRYGIEPGGMPSQPWSINTGRAAQAGR